MGNTKICRLLEQESKWTDDKCERHKHDFCIPCFIKVISVKKGHPYEMDYKGTKCLYCNSFVDAEYADTIAEKRPTVVLIKAKFALGFKDCKLAEMPKPY